MDVTPDNADRLARHLADALGRSAGVVWLGNSMTHGSDRYWKRSEELFHVSIREGLLQVHEADGNAPRHRFDEVEVAVCDTRRPRGSNARVHTEWIERHGEDAAAVRSRFNSGFVDMLLEWQGATLLVELKRETHETACGGQQPGTYADLVKLRQVHGEATRALYTGTSGGNANPKINTLRRNPSWFAHPRPLVGVAVGICDRMEATYLSGNKRLRSASPREATLAPDTWVLSGPVPVAGGLFSLLLGLVIIPEAPPSSHPPPKEQSA